MQDSPAHINSHVAQEIQHIIEAQGRVSQGLLNIGIDRKDIRDVRLHGVRISASFQINGTLVFQQVGSNGVLMNGDMALKKSEVLPFIDAMLEHDIVFQAEHQHFYDFDPMVWFIHFRKHGNYVEVAKAIKAALNKTSTPFPQTMPAKPTTPLPADRIADILGGPYSIGGDGVVTVEVARAEALSLGGRHINPFLNVATTVAFQPHGGGKHAAAAPDFGMVAKEIDGVVGDMRSKNWDIGCLYNQETDEYPQLYFCHMFKTGDAVALAHEIKDGLKRMHVMRMDAAG